MMKKLSEFRVLETAKMIKIVNKENVKFASTLSQKPFVISALSVLY